MDMPRDLMQRTKAVAGIQGKSVKQLVMELMGEHLKDLERKGIFPRGK